MLVLNKWALIFGIFSSIVTLAEVESYKISAKNNVLSKIPAVFNNKVGFNDEEDDRIVGGEEGKIEDLPYMVGLYIFCIHVQQSCGASIINQRMVLTAAHCIDDCRRNPDWVVVMHFGSIYLNMGDQVIGASRSYVHRDFIREKLVNDIGLLYAAKPIKLGLRTSRVTLRSTFPRKFPIKSVVSGWGYYNEDSQSHVLLYLEVDVLTPKECSKYNTRPGTFCAAYKKDSDKLRYAYRGDSGSPLVLADRTQIGIVSLLPSTGREIGITVYTNVSYFYEWIFNKTKEVYCLKSWE